MEVRPVFATLPRFSGKVRLFMFMVASGRFTKHGSDGQHGQADRGSGPIAWHLSHLRALSLVPILNASNKMLIAW